MKFLVNELKQFKIVKKDEEGNSQDVIWDAPEWAHFVGKVKTEAEARLIDTDVLATGQVSAQLRFNCVRCLNDFETSLTAQFQQIYFIEGELIDISTEVRESFLIELPVHPVCNPNCQGVIPSPANQHNPSVFFTDELKSDPRWDELKKIDPHKGNQTN